MDKKKRFPVKFTKEPTHRFRDETGARTVTETFEEFIWTVEDIAADEPPPERECDVARDGNRWELPRIGEK